MTSIFLIGPPSVGKTVCGKLLSQKLNCRFLDTDQVIEEQQQLTIAEIFETRGEGYFRKIENKLLCSLEIQEKTTQTTVYAAGGGLPVYHDNMERLLRIGKVIWLDADLKTLVKRLGTDNRRPLLKTFGDSSEVSKLDANHIAERLNKLLTSRHEVYSRAQYRIDTSRLSAEEVTDEIDQLLGLTQR